MGGLGGGEAGGGVEVLITGDGETGGEQCGGGFGRFGEPLAGGFNGPGVVGGLDADILGPAAAGPEFSDEDAGDRRSPGSVNDLGVKNLLAAMESVGAHLYDAARRERGPAGGGNQGSEGESLEEIKGDSAG